MYRGVCTGCRVCRFHRPLNKKVKPEGRIPLPTEPMDTWMIDFMVFKKKLTFYEGRYQQPSTSWIFTQTFSSHTWCLIRQLKPSLSVWGTFSQRCPYLAKLLVTMHMLFVRIQKFCVSLRPIIWKWWPQPPLIIARLTKLKDFISYLGSCFN